MDTRAAIYLRLSEATDTNRATLADHQREAEALCAREGWAVHEVYADDGLSAFRAKRRPAWTRLLADAGERAFQVVVAHHDDRLWRDVTEQQLVFGQLAGFGVQTVALTRGRTYATGSGDDAFLSGLQALMAQKESADKSRRLRRKHEQLAREGRNGAGGPRPFGYAADRVTVEPAEAELVREAAQRVLLGDQPGTVAADWNRRGVATVTGSSWRTTTMRQMLLSPRIAGLRELRGEVVGPAVWPAIITAAEHERLRRVLTDPTRRKGGRPREYLLTGGIGRCGKCGARLQGRSDRRGQRQYVCPSPGQTDGCNGLACLAAPLEAEVRDQVVTALSSNGLPERLAARGEDDGGHLVEELRAAEDALRELDDDYYQRRRLPRARYLEQSQQLEGRVAAARDALARRTGTEALAGLPTDPDKLTDRWEAEGMAWRRAVLAAAVERVTLLPTTRGTRTFEPDRVQVRWAL